MIALERTIGTGVLPAVKSNSGAGVVEYVEAMVEGGARVVEITFTTPGCLDTVRDLSRSFGDSVSLAVGTVLDPESARLAILAGAGVIVTPVTNAETIATAHRYGVPCFAGALSPTEVLAAVTAGADMVKVFPAELHGPKYMTHLRRVFPHVRLIPSGGIDMEAAEAYIAGGATAISGARSFMASESDSGPSGVADVIRRFIDVVATARSKQPTGF